MTFLSSTFAQLKRFRIWVAAPPYEGIPWVVWTYALISCLLVTRSGVFAGLLTGYDDHVRMTQILNWINGAGWYDRTIMRVNAPEGFTTIWSRLVDIPYAMLILFLQNFLEQRIAALYAAFVVPLAELAILFSAARYFARPLLGKNKARLIVLFLMFASVMNYKSFSMSGFHTGEASHHSWYIILTLLTFGAAGRLALGATGPFPAIMMGAAIGLLHAVGIEGYPLIAGTVVLLASLAWFYGRPVIAFRAMQAMIFSAMLSLLLLPLHQPPEKLFTVSFAEPSILGPILSIGAASFLGTQYAVLKEFPNRRWASLLLGLMAAAVVSGALIGSFPQILQGPAAALTPLERVMVFREHAELKPLYAVATDWLDYLSLLMSTLIALIAGVIAIRSAKTRRRQTAAVAYFGFAALAGGFAEIFSRFYHHAMTTACVWLAWAWQDIASRLKRNRNYSLAAFGHFILLGPLWMLLVPAFNDNVAFASQLLFYPAKTQSVPDACNSVGFGYYLDRHYDKDTLLMVPGADSSRMLYYSNLKIDFLNNYPSHDKFYDNQVFFGTQDINVAKDIARRHHFDLVAVCSVTGNAPPLKPGEEPMMFERLDAGQPPAWLKRVNPGIIGYYKLYEVDKTALKK